MSFTLNSFEFSSVELICLNLEHFIHVNQLHREYVYSVAVYQKYLTRLGELIIFELWRENYLFSQSS